MHSAAARNPPISAPPRSTPQFELLLDVAEDSAIAQRLRERDAADDGTSSSPSSMPSIIGRALAGRRTWVDPSTATPRWPVYSPIIASPVSGSVGIHVGLDGSAWDEVEFGPAEDAAPRFEFTDDDLTELAAPDYETPAEIDLEVDPAGPAARAAGTPAFPGTQGRDTAATLGDRRLPTGVPM